MDKEKERSADKFRIKGVDELFGNGFDNMDDDIQEIPIDQLKEFKNHPFKVAEDKDMEKLADSISKQGILYPILCRESKNSYEIIAGHRRVYAAKMAGLTRVPAIVKNLSDEDAILMMVDTNIQREHIEPSEKAKAYRMKMDALGQKGKKGEKNVNTANDLGTAAGDSGRMVSRYIRLSYLIPKLLELVDEHKLGVTTSGQALAYLSEREQDLVYEVYETSQQLPDTAQAEVLKSMSQELKKSGRELDIDDIRSVFVAQVKTKKESKKASIKIQMSKISSYFADGTSDKEMQDIIISLLEKWSGRYKS